MKRANTNKPKPECQEVLEKLVKLRVENELEIQSQEIKAKADKARWVYIFIFNNLTKYDTLVDQSTEYGCIMAQIDIPLKSIKSLCFCRTNG